MLNRLVRRMLQRAFHGWFLLSRGMTLGVRGAVLDEAGRVFLVRHTYTPGWHMPGGGVELGETAAEALRRELDEEARVEMTGDPVLHGVFLNRRATRRDHVLVFVLREFRVLDTKKPDREIAEAGFFPLAALPPTTTAGTRARLAEITGAAERSAIW